MNNICFIGAGAVVSWLMVALYAARVNGTDPHGDASFQLLAWSVFALIWSARLLWEVYRRVRRR